MDTYAIQRIGTVRCRQKTPRFGGWQDLESEIHVESRYVEGLEGIEGYSHVVVVYWLDRVDKVKLKMHPQGKPGVPTVGIFACRCPSRPTPIGITACRLLRKQDNVLWVRGLDAVDGAPVIDLKPYWPHYDRVEAPEYPAWVDKLDF